MKKSKLVAILTTFSKRDLIRVKEYVFSPFFNKSKKVQMLCEFVLDFAPDFDDPKLSKRAAYSIVFGNEYFEEITLNNIISDLLQLVYAFQSYKQYEHRPQLQRNFLLEELLEKDIHSHIERSARRYRSLQDKSPYRNFEYFHDEYQFYDKKDRYFLTKGKRVYDENLQLKSDYLDMYYICNKIRIACDMQSRNVVTNAGYVCRFIEELLMQYKEGLLDVDKIPAVQVYYKTWQMLNHYEEKEYYDELKILLKKHHTLFPQEELRYLYNYLLNHSIKKINSGESLYYQEILEIYKQTLKTEVIFKNGFLTTWTYKNIATVGIRLKEFDWTETFIYQYKENLLPEEKANAFAYNLSAFFYAKKEFSKALQELHNVEFTDNFLHLNAKIIQLKSYFELEETEAFYALVDASKIFIQRSKQLSDYQKNVNLNFLKLAKKIIRLKESSICLNKSSILKKKKRIEEQLNNSSSIANKDWLIEKINGL